MSKPRLPEPIAEAISAETCAKLVLSERRRSYSGSVSKITVRPLMARGERVWQFTLQDGSQAVHENHPTRNAERLIADWLETSFLQALLETATETWAIRGNAQRKGEWKIRRTAKNSAILPSSIELPQLNHNRTKNYLIPVGTPCPFLIEMGVMTREGAVKNSMYHKFRQVNRFLELVQDVVAELPSTGTLHIVDFGCGKSYLTFALHHLLTVIHRRDVEITGLDLKSEVIEKCQEVATRLGCSGLRFQTGTISKFNSAQPVDLVVSLHACDTATDDALAQAIAWKTRAIMSVPCCQHELAPQLANSALKPLLSHGLLRERVAALATDALRAAVLEIQGYATQIVEFIDMEHTPKNILIRAIRREKFTESLMATRQNELADYKRALGLEVTHLETRLKKPSSE